MERFGKNLWDIFLENNRKFSEHAVYKIAIQIVRTISSLFILFDDFFFLSISL